MIFAFGSYINNYFVAFSAIFIVLLQQNPEIYGSTDDDRYKFYLFEAKLNWRMWNLVRNIFDLENSKVGSKIIRALEIIYVKKLTSNAVL